MKRAFLLLRRILSCSINRIELVTRYCWWISHPQAFSKLGKSNSLNSQSISTPLVDVVIFGGMGREPKKTPPLRLPSLARTCGYPIHPTLSKAREIVMSYSPFLLIGTHLLLAAVNLLRYGGLSNAY